MFYFNLKNNLNHFIINLIINFILFHHYYKIYLKNIFYHFIIPNKYYLFKINHYYFYNSLSYFININQNYFVLSHFNLNISQLNFDFLTYHQYKI